LVDQVDQEDIFAAEFTANIDERTHRIINVGLKRDEKFWHFQINRVPV
tara:strand:+ start:408 stop:551 length:144 start_codon:yes stop_codon:yes gene_type:complete